MNSPHRISILTSLALFISVALNAAVVPQAAIKEMIAKENASLVDLYKHFHATPELSFRETKSAERIASELKLAGFEVTTKVGGHGVVAVMRNGRGPTVLVRADLDGLPVKEETGLPYASKHTMLDEAGNLVSTMHACGHDAHMACLIGTARMLSRLKENWQGTLVMIGQPAEERGGGAKAMLEDGLYKRFPVPDYGLALHVAADLPTGTIGYVEGFAMANVDSVDIIVRGIGGHGAQPQSAKDPIVLSAQIILALQTIRSREIHPLEPAVVTVGSIHGGTKHNIISDEVRMQLTLRSYNDEVRKQMIDAISRITRGLGQAAGLPDDKLPIVELKNEHTPAAYNDPKLAKRARVVFEEWLGPGTVLDRKPSMGGEDFGQFGRTEHKVPVFLFFVGSINSARFKESLRLGKALPSAHSSRYAPDPDPTIKTGVTAMTAAVLELMRR